MSKSVVTVAALALLFPSVSHPALAQAGRNEVAAYTVADFSRASTGEFVAGWNAGTTITQGSSARIGESFEYRFALPRNNSVGLLYTCTPTNAKLFVPRSELIPQRYVVSWPVTRNEFDLLFTRRLKPHLRGILSPYVAGGGGAILLDGKAASGLDKQGAFVFGGGGDIRIASRLRLRIGLTTDILKASTYSDRAYRSSWTTVAEPRIGLVVPLGSPAER